MRLLLASAIAILVNTALFAETADAPHIGLSPQAEKNERIEINVALYKSMIDGSADARKSWENLNAEDRKSALARIAWSKDDGRYREKSIRALARLSPSDDTDGSGMKSLASVAVAEGDGSLRSLARKALTALDDKRTPNLLACALNIDDPMIKNNAIEALRDIGGPRVFEVIIEHWKEIWGAGPRDHVFIGNQRSYIADYDVSGNALDPVVKTFMTGVVLDAKIVKVEADVYYIWIREVTGEKKLPNDPAAWNHWVKKNEPQLAKQAEQNKVEAVNFFKD